MKTIGIIVVTFNRLTCLKKNIECLKHLNLPKNYQTQIIVINNNSTDGTTDYLDTLRNIGIINLKENTGGAGGFYTGIKWCMEQNFDYIWGMDDDAYVQPDALFNLIKCVENYGDNNGYWSNCNMDSEFETDVKEVNSWMFVGFFLSKNIIDKVGLPRNDFFIYHDDSEYAYRIIKNNFKIYKVRDSVIKHKDATSNCFSGKKFLFREIKNYSNIPDWKRYYEVRNLLLMYKFYEIDFWKVLLGICPKVIIASSMYNPKQLGVIFKAIYHGILRISGKKMNP